MSRKARSLASIDVRLRELAAAKSALEQDLDQALGRALRRTRDHAPADVWTAVQHLLAPHVRNDADRRALGLPDRADVHVSADASSDTRQPAPARTRDVVLNASSRRHAAGHRGARGQSLRRALRPAPSLPPHGFRLKPLPSRAGPAARPVAGGGAGGAARPGRQAVGAARSMASAACLRRSVRSSQPRP